MEYLLDNEGFQCSVDCKEPINGETALTASAARGRSAACEFLIRKYKAKIELRNKAGFTPLLCAVKHVSCVVIVVCGEFAWQELFEVTLLSRWPLKHPWFRSVYALLVARFLRVALKRTNLSL